MCQSWKLASWEHTTTPPMTMESIREGMKSIVERDLGPNCFCVLGIKVEGKWICASCGKELEEK